MTVSDHVLVFGLGFEGAIAAIDADDATGDGEDGG